MGTVKGVFCQHSTHPQIGTLCRPYSYLVIIEWEKVSGMIVEGFDQDVINHLSSEDDDMAETVGLLEVKVGAAG